MRVIIRPHIGQDVELGEVPILPLTGDRIKFPKPSWHKDDEPRQVTTLITDRTFEMWPERETEDHVLAEITLRLEWVCVLSVEMTWANG